MGNKGYLLDTDVVIAHLRGYPQTVALLKALTDRARNLSISAATIVELEVGIRSKEKQKTYEFLEVLEIHFLDRPIAHLAGSFLREYRGKGISLGLADVIIGATAIAKELILVTYNTRHYPMPGIQMISHL